MARRSGVPDHGVRYYKRMELLKPSRSPPAGTSSRRTPSFAVALYPASKEPWLRARRDYRDDPADVKRSIQLARRVRAKINLNLFWVPIYNLIAIPVAPGILCPSLGLLN